MIPPPHSGPLAKLLGQRELLQRLQSQVQLAGSRSPICFPIDQAAWAMKRVMILEAWLSR